MRSKSLSSIHLLLAALATAGFAGCADTTQREVHPRHHRGVVEDARPPDVAARSPSHGGMAGTAGTEGGPCAQAGGGACGTPDANTEAMCAMYRGMRDAPSEQERQARMEARMGGMAPAMRQQHMEMMRQRCR